MDQEKAERAVRDLLTALDIDVAKQHMEKTPARVAKMYAQLFDGCQRTSAEIWGETFPTPASGIVAVRHIPFYSMCEHHLVPFFGEVQIAYAPHKGRVAGFSKFMAMVEVFAHRPQLQERLTRQIADAVMDDLQADGVLVVVEAHQLCMTMRGEAAHGSRTVTTESSGSLQSGSMLYQEAWMLLMKEEKR